MLQFGPQFSPQFNPANEHPPFSIFTAQAQHFPSAPPSEAIADDLTANDAGSVPIRFIELFEEITGWVIQFSESPSSKHQRRLPGTKDEPAAGEFSIVDMSANWPANTPTCHRAKCDELVEMLGRMATELHSTRSELAQTRSVLEGLSPGTADDEEILVDSFVPTSSQLDGKIHDWGRARWDADHHSETLFDESFILVEEYLEHWNCGEASDAKNLDLEKELELDVFQTIPKPSLDPSINDSSKPNPERH